LTGILQGRGEKKLEKSMIGRFLRRWGVSLRVRLGQLKKMPCPKTEKIKRADHFTLGGFEMDKRSSPKRGELR